jgi:hypothetical protein
MTSIEEVSGESASKFVELKDLSSLITKTTSLMKNQDGKKVKNYFKSKENALSVVYKGYTVLPSVYSSEFVEPLKKLIENFYDDICSIIKQNNNDATPYVDWLDSIEQRYEGYLRAPTHAFEQVINDLYDGWCSAESRLEVKPPDNQIVSPLIRWAATDDGAPYTIPAENDIVGEYNIRMSVVTMPPSYSKNIALWGALAHECAHDITIADNGLMTECSQLVYKKILNETKFTGHEVTYNGRREPFSKRAAEVWKFWIYETVADVLGVLNFGPASGIALATILMASNQGRLSNMHPAPAPHPIDSLRLFLAADIIRNIPSLHANIANSWSDALERMTYKYMIDKNEVSLVVQTPNDLIKTVTFPFEPLRETAKIVAQTLAFSPLETLENHYFSEINTWVREDEILANRIVDELLNKKEPSLDNLGGETDPVYPTHIISGAVIALTESSQTSDDITELAISALNKSYDRNPVWRGFPIRYASDIFVHKAIPPRRLTTDGNSLKEKEEEASMNTRRGGGG